MMIHPRGAMLLVLLGLFCVPVAAQDVLKPKKIPHRFGYDLDMIVYPQKTPKDAMASIISAISRNKVDYLLAHITDPHYVDYWVDRYKADFSQGRDQAKVVLAFERLARETKQYFEDDPLIVKDLYSFAREAEWTENEDLAVGAVKTLPSRKVFMRRIEGRWFLENRQQDDPARK